jgi:hypothetical protein
MIRGDREKSVREIAGAFGSIPPVGVETGTWKGDTTEAMSKIFSEVYTVDLSMKCYKDALSRFSSKKNVFCLFGDSGEIVKHLALQISCPVFWLLDAHHPFNWFPKDTEFLFDYSPCPLFTELKEIVKRKTVEIIAVDDVSGFGGNEYWKEVTMDSIFEIVQPEDSVVVQDTLVMRK